MTIYRQLAPRIRVQRGPGQPDYVSERPRTKPGGPFTDSDSAPTLVEFDDGCIVNVAFLLRTGAIAEVSLPESPPELSPPQRSRRVPAGEPAVLGPSAEEGTG